MEQTVPGVCSWLQHGARKNSVATLSCPKIKSKKAMLEAEVSPRGNAITGLGSGTQLPGGGDDAAYRPLFQMRFYLVTLNHSGQTHSSACLLSTCTAAKAKTLRRSSSFASKHPGTLTLCRDSGGAAVLASFLSTSSCGCACPAPCPCLSQPLWGSGQALVFLLPFPSLPSACVSGQEEAALSFMKRREDKIGPLSL